MKNVYEKIRELRKLKDISQTEMAEKMNLTQAGYGKLERGDVQLTIERAYELATIFGVSVVELLGEGASVVVVGGGEGAKEMDALKARIQTLENEKEITALRLASIKERIYLLLQIFENALPHAIYSRHIDMLGDYIKILALLEKPEQEFRELLSNIEGQLKELEQPPLTLL